MISLAVAAAGWVGVSSPGDYAAIEFPPVPRHDPLEKALTVVLEDRAEREHRRLLKALPATVEPDVDNLLAAAKRKLLLLLARQNAVCEAAADAECRELRRDKQNANMRIDELDGDLAAKAADNATKAAEIEALTADLADAREQLRAAHAELEWRRREANDVERLRDQLRHPAVQSELGAIFAGLGRPAAAGQPPA